jgi:hypothetical protein
VGQYPLWRYFPSRDRPPDWVYAFLGVVESAKPSIDSTAVSALTSDKVLAFLRSGLVGIGYEVEAGRRRTRRSVARSCSASKVPSASHTKSTPYTTISESSWKSRPVAEREATQSIET